MIPKGDKNIKYFRERVKRMFVYDGNGEDRKRETRKRKQNYHQFFHPLRARNNIPPCVTILQEVDDQAF